jgi:hypothetical protein
MDILFIKNIFFTNLTKKLGLNNYIWTIKQ